MPGRQPHLYLDCDGVLADFDAGAKLLLGMSPKAFEARHGRGEFWKRLARHGNFYGDLEQMPDAQLLFQAVKHLKPTILTGNLNDALEGDHYADSVQYRLGPRTRSRLKEMCRWVHITSHDTRELGFRPSRQQLEAWKEKQSKLTGQTERTKGMAKAKLKRHGSADLKWAGGKAGS